ncbi:MAG: YhfC family glutamic-type intramembrane protease [Anaerolineales bacterium]
MKLKRAILLIILLVSAALLLTVGISQPETVFPVLNTFLMIGLGLGLGILLAQRFGLPWALYGAGALTFIASQVLHIPFNAYLLNPLLAKIAPAPQPGSTSLAVWGVLLGLSAGIFEETARYLMLKFWRKDVTTWRLSLMFGAGHGGIEAILVGLAAFIGFLQLFNYRQMSPEALRALAEGPQLEGLQAVIGTYWNYNWYEHLWGALERFSVLPVHLSATVMVYRGVREGKFRWYLAAVAWHALVDFFAVFAAQSWGIPLTEGILFLIGLLSWGIVFLLKEPAKPALSEPPAPVDPAPEELLIPPAQEKPITEESLEESRYE